MRAVRASEHEALAWQEVPRPASDDAPPGEEVATFRSAEGPFVTGLWRRAPEEGRMGPDDYHEISRILEGEFEVIEDDGTVHRAGPGDLLIRLGGPARWWGSLSPVKKAWAIYQGERGPDAWT